MQPKTQRISVKKLKPNPDNPRIVKDDKFAKLVKSIKDFPQMMELRPIVVDSDMVILGGNMRYKACVDAGMKDVPVVVASDLTDEQKKEFIIKDNLGYGEWDWQELRSSWDVDCLHDWGLSMYEEIDEQEPVNTADEFHEKAAVMKITFDSHEQMQHAEVDIRELIDRKYDGAYFSISV